MNSIHSENSSQAASTEQLLRKIYGSVITQMIAVAAQLKIADLLIEGPKSVERLADATDTHAPTLYRLMRALASEDIFEETDPGHFALTPVAELLQVSNPYSLRDYAILFGSDLYYHSWPNLLQSVQSGDSALEMTFGMNLFEYLQQNPTDATIFNEAMTSVSSQEAIAVSKAYDFSEAQTLVDVGGGHGILLATILRANPSLKGILFDRAAVVESASALLQNESIATRCEIAEGDFFTAVPTGGDVYILKYIIHDWDDERAQKILKNCREAMGPEGRLLVVDTVISAGNTPFLGKLKDIVMLAVTSGGIERTDVEFQNLFSSAGFKLNRIIPTQTIVSIIEGLPE